MTKKGKVGFAILIDNPRAQGIQLRTHKARTIAFKNEENESLVVKAPSHPTMQKQEIINIVTSNTVTGAFNYWTRKEQFEADYFAENLKLGNLDKATTHVNRIKHQPHEPVEDNIIKTFEDGLLALDE